MNPLFPLNEYIPDGEPHVFGDRVYLYGSHDRSQGERFCMEDYVVWSAPVSELENWKCHGVSYKKRQDPRSCGEREVDYYAPDCVRGNDGRYYLYYFAAGPNTKAFGPMSVAVSDNPEGPFEYLGDIRYPDGSPVLDFLTNDPAVINDGGRIWLYYGWGLGRDFRIKLLKPLYNFVLHKLCNRPLKTVYETKPSILSCAVVELDEDMTTVKSAPRAVLDSKTTAPRGSELYKHPFYEAPSIRKFGKLYYLVYSTGENNELAYATSEFPDRNFEYRGVIISGSDIGFNGNKKPRAPAGTIHGGIELINGRYYIFYHRCTNDTDFSRQACAEPIEILPGGEIGQVGVTTQGVGESVLADGKILAALCCRLYNSEHKDRRGSRAVITECDGEIYVTRLKRGDCLEYKYLSFDAPDHISVRSRGKASSIDIIALESGEKIATVNTPDSDSWQRTKCTIKPIKGNYTLQIKLISGKKLEISDIEFSKKGDENGDKN